MLKQFFNYLVLLWIGFWLARLGLIERPLHAFLNNPFDREMDSHAKFTEFKRAYNGKLNVINIHYGGAPYVVFTPDLSPNSANAEKVELTRFGSGEILAEFLQRGFVIDDYAKMAEEMMLSNEE